MSLDKERLGNGMADAVIAIMGADAPGSADEAQFRILMKALADEIIKEFVNNAVVNTALTVASVTLVTPGVGVSGPGTGTGTGTVS